MGKKKFFWQASSNDGSFTDCSTKFFESEEEAYKDMRNAVLEKMKWNTEYKEDLCSDGDEPCVIGYNVKFSRKEITHESYSGLYTYEIKEFVPNTTIKMQLVLDFDAPFFDADKMDIEVQNYLYEAAREKLAAREGFNFTITHVE